VINLETARDGVMAELLRFCNGLAFFAKRAQDSFCCAQWIRRVTKRYREHGKRVIGTMENREGNGGVESVVTLHDDWQGVE